MVVTKSFRIKTGENSFSDPINFLSTSVYLPSGKNLDTHLKDTETALGNRIDKEITDREKEDSALGGRIDTLNTGLTNNVSTLTGLINTETSQRKESISTLQTTVKENTDNISSLEVFIKGKNTIEENIPGLVDQVAANTTKAQDNYDAIEALKVLVGADSLEEGAPNLLNIINLLESRISVLEGLVLTAPDEPGEEGPVEPEIPEEGETEEPIE